MRKKLISGLFVLLALPVVWARVWTALFQQHHRDIEINVNVTYLTIGGWEGKLDVYSRSDTPGPHPTLIYFHGGGAIGSNTRKGTPCLTCCHTSSGGGTS